MRILLAILYSLLLLLPLSLEARGTEDTEKLRQEVQELKRIQETTSQLLAKTAQEVATIRQEIQEIKGAIEENKYFFQDESKRNEKILTEYDYRLTGMEEKLALYGSQLTDFLTRTNIPTDPAVTKKQEKVDAEYELYKKGLSEVNLQRYKAAITTFDEFLKKYPKSKLADNAQYWKGEALYASKDYPKAILEYQKVIEKYPKSDKVPGAILKQGYSFYELENYMDAKAFLETVLKSHSRSEAASFARERIRKIDRLLAQKEAANTKNN